MYSCALLADAAVVGSAVSFGRGKERRATHQRSIKPATTMHRLPIASRARTLPVSRAAFDEGSASTSVEEAPVANVGENEAGAGGGCPMFRTSSSSSSSSLSTPSSSSPDISSLPLPPGTLGLPIIGETAEMLRDAPLFHKSRRERHGDVYKTRILGGEVATVHGAAECRRLLLADGALTETNWPDITRALMGPHSVLFQTGAKHAAQRRLLGTAFTSAAVDGYLPLVESAVASNLEAWASEGAIRGISAGKDLAFEVAVRALIADVMDAETMKLFRDDFDTVVEGMMGLPYNLGRFSKFGRALQARERVLSRIDGLIDDAIERKKKEEKEQENSVDAGADGKNKNKKKKSRNAIDLLLSAVDPETGEAATRDELKDQILTQMFAGHETTGTTICRLLKVLSSPSNAGVLSKLRDEQERRAERFGKALTPESTTRDAMPYTDAVINETLRAWPIVHGVFRSALRDLAVESVDRKTGETTLYRVPAGWRLQLVISSTTRESAGTSLSSPSSSSDFDPDRWLSPATSPASLPSSFFSPFGAGPHVCLGMSLATQELRACLALLARGYEWEVVDPREPWVPPKLPEKGLEVLFWRRGEGEAGKRRAIAAARAKGWIE